MIYRRKATSAASLPEVIDNYQATYAALKAPRGAALLGALSQGAEVVIMLTQDYCDAFELISPGGWESVYDPDLSGWEVLAGDSRATACESRLKYQSCR